MELAGEIITTLWMVFLTADGLMSAGAQKRDNTEHAFIVLALAGILSASLWFGGLYD